MKVYNKLVRDKIPDIIEAGGERPVTKFLGEDEFRLHLEQKLDEEVAEFHKDKTVEELADILEVVYALAGDRVALEKAYRVKHEARGGFEKRIFLISKED